MSTPHPKAAPNSDDMQETTSVPSPKKEETPNRYIDTFRADVHLLKLEKDVARKQFETKRRQELEELALEADLLQDRRRDRKKRSQNAQSS